MDLIILIYSIIWIILVILQAIKFYINDEVYYGKFNSTELTDYFKWYKKLKYSLSKRISIYTNIWFYFIPELILILIDKLIWKWKQ